MSIKSFFAQALLDFSDGVPHRKLRSRWPVYEHMGESGGTSFFIKPCYCGSTMASFIAAHCMIDELDVSGDGFIYSKYLASE